MDVKRTSGEAVGSVDPTRLTRTGHKRQRLVDCNIVFVSRSDKSPMPVRPMPSAVHLQRVRDPPRPTGNAPTLGLFEALLLDGATIPQPPCFCLRRTNTPYLLHDTRTRQ